MARQHEERRLITILAADVVGYSRLMAADEAGTFARRKADRKELIEPITWPAPSWPCRGAMKKRLPRISRRSN